jgi:chromosome segregation ATPase
MGAIISVNDAQSMVKLGNDLTAFLELAKDVKGWKKLSTELDDAAKLVADGKVAFETLRNLENIKAPLDAALLEVETGKAALQADKAAFEKQVAAFEVDSKGVSDVIAKAEKANLDAIAIQKAAQLELEAASFEKEKAKEAQAKAKEKAKESEEVISKYNQAIANLQAAKV